MRWAHTETSFIGHTESLRCKQREIWLAIEFDLFGFYIHLNLATN